MIAVDTNILIYSHREESPFHERALSCITDLSEGRASWAIPWPCIHEFFSIVTHPRIYYKLFPMSCELHPISYAPEVSRQKIRG